MSIPTQNMLADAWVAGVDSTSHTQKKQVGSVKSPALIELAGARGACAMITLTSHTQKRQVGQCDFPRT